MGKVGVAIVDVGLRHSRPAIRYRRWGALSEVRVQLLGSDFAQCRAALTQRVTRWHLVRDDTFVY